MSPFPSLTLSPSVGNSENGRHQGARSGDSKIERFFASWNRTKADPKLVVFRFSGIGRKPIPMSKYFRPFGIGP